MSEDIKRAREYGDQFRRYLLGATTGAIGVTISLAGYLVGAGIPPRWATPAIAVFCFGLVVIGASLLMGEHRSLLRRRDPDAQSTLAWYKMGITWNLIALAVFILGIVMAIVALNRIEIAPPGESRANVASPAGMYL